MRIECNYVQDLLPLYIDDIVRDETKNQITEHLNKCEVCREIYQNMTRQVQDIKLKNIDTDKNFFKQTKKLFITKILNSIMFLAIAICFIVNIAVNHKLTWFPIVAVSIIYGLAIINTMVRSEKNKIVKGMIVVSAGLIILLATIQYSTYYLLDNKYLWYFKFGLPIAFLWLALVWITIILNKFLKLGVFYSNSVLFTCFFIGSCLTRIITGDIKNIVNLFDVLGFLIMAIIFFLIGKFKNNKDR